MFLNLKKAVNLVRTKNTRIKIIISFLSIFCYIASLFLPAAIIDDELTEIPAKLYGYVILILGWVYGSSGNVGWYSNPLLAIGFILYLYNRKKCAQAIISIAIIIALSSTQFANFHKALIGFYFWIASFVILWLGCFISEIKDKKT